jgi:hypothetical protein
VATASALLFACGGGARHGEAGAGSPEKPEAVASADEARKEGGTGTKAKSEDFGAEPAQESAPADIAEEQAPPPPEGAASPQRSAPAVAAPKARIAGRGQGFGAGGGSLKGLQAPRPMGPAIMPRADFNTENYSPIQETEFSQARTTPLSTFSIDVDTASYSNTRRFLTEGTRPPADSVRVEELINYFSYDYPAPRGAVPFSVSTEVSDCPWNPEARLVHIGLQGKTLSNENVPARNLVFLLDVSGSMSSPDKLPLLKRGMSLLTQTLRPQDKVSIAVYAGASGLVLPPTSGSNQARIMEALDRLEAGGSTNGGAGIELAYEVATRGFVKGGINRVILATDGDFNVGTTSEGDLQRLIEKKRKTGVFLTVLGFGSGNLKDSTMETLADKGNGNYAYIDSIAEARKALVREAGSTLVTIAKDVKLQVEFNPALVESYRLPGPAPPRASQPLQPAPARRAGFLRSRLCRAARQARLSARDRRHPV